jgi:hypothetical protein
MRHAVTAVVIAVCAAGMVVGDVVYQTDFDDLAIAHTQPYPGHPHHDGWFSAYAPGDAYGEVQDLIVNGGHALHEHTDINNNTGEQTIDRRDLTPPDLDATPIITVSVDFYCHTSDLWAVNTYLGDLAVWGGPHPGFKIIGFSVAGGNGPPKIDTGVGVTIYGFNGSDNNDFIPLEVGQDLAWDTWHNLTLIIDHASDTYVSITVDGDTEDLAGFLPPRSFDGSQWVRGQLMEYVIAQIVPTDWSNPPDETDDEVYWDNLSIVVSGGAITGDVDGDGDVDLNDLALLLAAYGACDGDPDYNPDADFDDSGRIDLSDLAALLSSYGYGT